MSEAPDFVGGFVYSRNSKIMMPIHRKGTMK